MPRRRPARSATPGALRDSAASPISSTVPPKVTASKISTSENSTACSSATKPASSGLYGHIQANRLRSALLLAGFAALLHALLFSLL